MWNCRNRPGSIVATCLRILIVVAAASRSDAAIVGVFEEPEGISSGVGNVRGWAYSTVKGATILSPLEVRIDGAPAYQVPCCSARGDVVAADPKAPLDTGFSGVFNWGLLTPGMHDVEVVVKSSAGESRTFSVKITTVRIGDKTFLSRLRFTGESKCTFGNASAGGDDARIVCTNLLAEQAKDGAVSLCAGGISISWNKASQSFEVTSDCKSACTKDADCDDGIFCNGVESCDVDTGLCVALSSCPPFLDGCVVRGGICDEATDTCLDDPDDAACDDGVFCNGVESCDVATGTCVAIGSCPLFVDGCVTRGAICDEATDTCLDDPDDAACDDGIFCNGVESCDAATGLCVAVGSCPPTIPTGCVTPDSICDEATDMCLDDLDDGKCPVGTTCQPDGSCAL